MAFTDEALKAKLSTLNESQDSIVSVSQWIMFHRRHADRIANHWLQRLRENNTQKRLNLLYLANEIVQNARARRKDDFPDAFSPIMPEAAQTAYRSSTPEVQLKIRRLIEVWRQRSVFEQAIQDAIEARLQEIDKSRPAGKKPLVGGTFVGAGPSIPKSLEPLVSLQTALSKHALGSTSATTTAETEYTRLNGPDNPPPAPLHAARLSALLKTLNTASTALSQTITTRTALISSLETLLESTRAAQTADEATLADLSRRREDTDSTRRSVEDSIRRAAVQEIRPTDPLLSVDPERPEFEALTPPPPEPLTPPPISPLHPQEPQNPDLQNLLASIGSDPLPVQPAPGGSGLNGFGASAPPAKKRKLFGQMEEVVPTDLGVDLDRDVEEMIRQESGGMG